MVHGWVAARQVDMWQRGEARSWLPALQRGGEELADLVCVLVRCRAEVLAVAAAAEHVRRDGDASALLRHSTAQHSAPTAQHNTAQASAARCTPPCRLGPACP